MDAPNPSKFHLALHVGVFMYQLTTTTTMTLGFQKQGFQNIS